MRIKNSLSASIILSTILCWSSSAKSGAKDGELEVKLQFLEFELEDFCTSKNEAEWKFLNGSEHDLRKFLDVELKEADFYKHELEILQKHIGKKFSKRRLQRLVDIFSHPGAPLLGSIEFKEYRDYSIKLQELTRTMKILCKESTVVTKANTPSNSSDDKVEKCSPINHKKVNEILYSEKKEKELKDVWIKWYKNLGEKNKKTKYDFVQQLTILDLEAEQNGEEELADYWLKQMDTTWIDYEKAENLWREIFPLYEKLKSLMISLVTQNFGKDVLRNQKIIPAHVLGSLKTYDWITAGEKLGAFESSEVYKSIRNSLKQKKIDKLYKIADNQTAELKLGYLPQNFYEKSHFNVSSQNCHHKIMNSCERGNIGRVMFCVNDVPSVRDYIEIHENVMRMKYQMISSREEEENGYLFREGPRESALYEAVEGLASLRAFWPENLENAGLIGNQTEQQKTILGLLITALHVIPPLPYYLATDLWRINALREVDATVGENAETTTLPTFSSSLRSLRKRKVNQNEEENLNPGASPDDGGFNQEVDLNNGQSKTYDSQNLTKDWWSYRAKYQGIGPPDEEVYEDYLQDVNIIWNKPYLSKFLGRILQFQILESSGNLTVDLPELQAMMAKGKSETWQFLVEETFNITDISVGPLLKYFKPLEEFLDKRIKLKNQSQIFSFADLDFISQGFSLNPPSNEGEGEKPAESSDALFFSLAVIAAVGVVAFIVTVGRRRYKRKLRARERKRRLAEL